MEHPTFLYCEDCKKIAAVIEGSPTLACCGDPMKALRANTSDGAAEKHVPVVKKQGSTVEVCVGDVPHPMSREHSIGWVCLVTKAGCTMRVCLDASCEPVAHFTLEDGDSVKAAYAYCNLHGFWKTEI